MNNKNKIYFYIIAVLPMLFWGMSFIWFKIANKYYPPITIVFLRLVIASVIMFAVLKPLGKIQKIKSEDIKLLLIVALCEPFCYFIGESFGLTLVPASMASIIISTIPVFTPIMAFFMLKEKITLTNIIGIVVSFLGIVVMVLKKNLSFSASPLGVCFLFFAVLSALFYTVYVKRLSAKYSAFTIVTYQNIIGMFLFMPLFLIFDFNKIIQIKLNSELVSSLVLLSVFASSLAFMMFIIVMKKIGVNRVNVYTNLIPVFTVVLSYFILSEEITAGKIAGMILILVGLIISQTKKTIINIFW
ncbi:MAG: DMT family transporter [Bacteroidales bacterium]|nr:DMT family transporter [Bacteroidales bacterium]